MTQRRLALTPLAAAVSLALLSMGYAHAQTASAPAPSASQKKEDDKDVLQLDKVVVTGTTQAVSKMKQSVSVSTLGVEQIQQSNAASAAEVLRSIPGVRSESSGGESNANLTIRGLPISAGGARYVQFQEDGLPVLQFGDSAFTTPDTWVRADAALDRLEVIRGGSASTLATNAPGGIINFITQTGEEKQGTIALTTGLDYDQLRYDFTYGSPITEKTRFFVGGYYRTGEGVRNGGVNVEQGGQIRGNITHELKGGFIRASFKVLDDHAGTYLPVPVRFSGGQISELPGIDPRRASFYSPYWLADSTLTYDNGRTSSNINDGLTVKSTAVGAEAQFDLGQGFKLNNKFRVAKNSGRFIGVFPGDDPAPAPAGTTYLTGPNRGQPYRGNSFTAVVFNTSMDKMDLSANDLKISKDIAIDRARLSVGAGLYTANQNVGLTWNFNQYLLEATGDKPAVLSSAINGTPGFGGCCMNFIDAQYKVSAPYFSLAYETGPINLDASVRRDNQKATGIWNQTLSVAANSGLRYDPRQTNNINYEIDRTSYSFGGNYRITNDLAVFLRYSDGVSFNADRITFFNNPGLTNGSISNVPINKVKQTEAGVKWRAGSVSTFVTLFQAKTDETNFDVTTQRGSANSYDAKGVEFEGAYRMGGFRLSGGLTYTDAKITASSDRALIGTTPKRQAKWVYQFSPSYEWGPFMGGISVVGNTDSKDDSPAGPITVTLPGFAVVNAFINYRLTDNTTLSLGANNLLDKIGYTESNDGRQAARSVNGRSIKATVKYTF